MTRQASHTSHTVQTAGAHASANGVGAGLAYHPSVAGAGSMYNPYEDLPAAVRRQVGMGETPHLGWQLLPIL
jgi:hypothetical protein